MKIRNRFTRTRTNVPHVATTAVKQEFKKEVDINFIINRMKTGVNPPAWMTSRTPHYGDYTNGPQTLMESFQVVQDAQTAFLSLPLAMRRELDHDFRNLDQAPKEIYERYGLLQKPAAAGSGSAAPEVRVEPEGQGDADLPVKAPSGANKRSPKGTSKTTDE